MLSTLAQRCTCVLYIINYNYVYIYIYPLVMINIAIENDHRNSGFSHWKWWFSIAMLVYQRVYVMYIYIYICTEEMIELTCIRFQRQTHVELKLFHVVPRSLALCTNSSCAKAPPNSVFGSERDGLWTFRRGTIINWSGKAVWARY